MRGTRFAIGALVAAGVLSSGGTAWAAPSKGPNAQAVTVNCGQGDFTAYVNGNGDWTPAHVGNKVFHPIAFGEFTGTFTVPGQGTFPIDDPPFARKTTPANGKSIIHCDYSLTFTDRKSGGSGTGSGSVDGWYS